MSRIDAHQHFWRYDPQKHSWINDQMEILKQDFLPADLRKELSENGMDGSVAVQADQSEEETFFLLELADANDFIKGVVGWVDLRSPTLDERLEYFSQYPKLCGFRHAVQDEPDVNFLLREDMQNGISRLGKYGFTYDILIFPTQMEAALTTIRNHPEQAFVIDHIAKPNIKKQEVNYWERYIRAMAEFPNVYCKLSGMITEADWDNWQYKDFVPCLDIIFESFGMDRLMYGSDWPVCLLAGSYKNVNGLIDNYTRSFSEADRAKIYGGNARTFYKLQ